MSGKEDLKRKQLHPDSINACVKRMEYAVRGELVLTALELQTKLKKQKDGDKKLPFDEIVFSNLGNPQELGQKPLTFISQVLSLINAPSLLAQDDKEAPNSEFKKALRTLYPEDMIKRSKTLLSNISGGLGAYTHSKGIPYIRQNVANFIAKRDGYPSDPENIFLTNGASPAIHFVLQLLIRDDKDGILIPNPQYPLYTATIQECGGAAVPYRLDESKDWSINWKDLESSVAAAKKKGINIRAMVIINPGNPTGQCLTRDDIAKVTKYASKNKFVLLADEVYQANVYNEDRPFHSFKKVLRDLEKAGDVKTGEVELFSFHSVSKGVLGECGRRGGYLEGWNIHPEIISVIYKLASVSLCSNSTGQVVVDLMVNPPQKGDESYELYEKESKATFLSLKRRAEKLVAAFNKMEGMSCTPVTGALYAFPRITLPPKAVKAASAAGKAPDVFYCLELLKHTGICLVPGSGFAVSKEEIYHFRTTILPSEDKIDGVIDRIGKFHSQFMDKYRNDKKKSSL